MNDLDLDRALDAWSVPGPPPSLRAAMEARLPAQPKRRIRFRWVAAAALATVATTLATPAIRSGVLSSDTGAWDERTYVRRTRIVEPPIGKFLWMLRSGRTTGWQWWGDKLA